VKSKKASLDDTAAIQLESLGKTFWRGGGDHASLAQGHQVLGKVGLPPAASS
jgi:hypothetical protein